MKVRIAANLMSIILTAVGVAAAQTLSPAQTFANIFATVLRSEHPDTGNWGPATDYLQIGSTTAVPLADSLTQYRVLIVPGFLSACVPTHPAFQEGKLHLQSVHGVVVDYWPAGDASCIENGNTLAGYLKSRPVGPKYIVIGHSKGAADLQVALQQPDVATRVAAFVSVAGAVRGSYLANASDDAGILVGTLEKELTCTGKLQDAINDLQTTARQEFDHMHPNPPVRSYSLVAVSDFLQTSLVLQSGWNALRLLNASRGLPGYGMGQDGLLLAADGYLPGAQNLGVAKADHIAVAHTFSEFPTSVLCVNTFPRNALLEAIVRYVIADLLQR
jgi:hypothetical protein